MARPIIFLEANEIPWRVLQHYAQARPKTALADVLSKSRRYITQSEDAGILMPWTTWPGVHRGVCNKEHEIYHFGQSTEYADERFPAIWEILQRSGLPVGVCGSLHSGIGQYPLDAYQFFMPDTFSPHNEAHPRELKAFQQFNLTMTRRSARNVDSGIPVKAALEFVRSAASLGVRGETVLDAGRQILTEIFKPHLKARRRAYQPLITFDIFEHFLERTRPAFATFYTNHVAAAMHRYWAASFPEDYAEFGLERQWVDRYEDEILFSMDKLDRIVGRLQAFISRNDAYMLIIGTSMGQAATEANSAVEFLTITNPGQLMRAMGIPDDGWTKRPTMVPDFSFEFTNEHAKRFAMKFATLSINGEPIESEWRSETFVHVLAYEERSATQPRHATVTLGNTEVPIATVGLGYIPHQDEVSCTAQHIPAGALTVYDCRQPAFEKDELEVSNLDITPGILAHFGLDVPDYMRGSPRWLHH
jgi:hypothetical protein